MPQIAQIAETYASQIFWLLLTFGFVFFVIGLGMVPKVQSTVDARDGKIADDLAQAKAAFARADEIEADYKAKSDASRAAAHQVTVEARLAATKAAELRLAEADTKIGAKLAEAEVEIRAATTSAMAEIESVAAEAAMDMVAKISGGKATAAAAKKAVKAALANG